MLAAAAIVALTNPSATDDERLDGALVLVGFVEDLNLIRRVLVEVK